MKSLFQWIVDSVAVLACVAVASVAATQAAEPALLKAGFAETHITPEPGMEKPGGYGKTYLHSVHDPCKVRAAVFDDGRTRVALVGIDTMIVSRSLVKAVRKEIEAKCGIAPGAVLIGASHSHSGGPVGMVQPGEYDHASPLVRELAYKRSSCADAGYLRLVRTQIVAAVCKANACREVARCGVGSGSEGRVSFNRRYRMKNGRTYTNPGKGNPDVVEPAGPIDPEVGVVGAWSKSGKLLGCVVNFTCHATTPQGGAFSANWICYLEQTIRKMLGERVVVVFLQGDCGDIAQCNAQSPYVYRTGFRWARVVGGCVGAEAVKVLMCMSPGPLGPLNARSKILNIKRRVPNPEKVRRYREQAAKNPRAVGVWAKETLMLDALIAKHPAVEVEVQAIQIGPAVFVTNPAEMFVEYGLELKAKSRMPLTFAVELANGCVGYVPTEEAFGPHGGGYETRLTAYSNLQITAGRQMLEAGLELIGPMKPGTPPTPPKAGPFKASWSFGNVPPELD